jgi:hypothetical protein
MTFREVYYVHTAAVAGKGISLGEEEQTDEGREYVESSDMGETAKVETPLLSVT